MVGQSIRVRIFKSELPLEHDFLEISVPPWIGVIWLRKLSSTYSTTISQHPRQRQDLTGPSFKTDSGGEYSLTGLRSKLWGHGEHLHYVGTRADIRARSKKWHAKMPTPWSSTRGWWNSLGKFTPGAKLKVVDWKKIPSKSGSESNSRKILRNRRGFSKCFRSVTRLCQTRINIFWKCKRRDAQIGGLSSP